MKTTQLNILEFTPENYKGGVLARFCGEDCSNAEAFKIGKAMAKLMVEKKGVGLAANQVGFLYQLLVILIKGKPIVLFKPKIIKVGKEKSEQEEGCLSLPGINQKINRATMIKFSAIINKNGKRKEFTLYDFEARCFQHEFDHLCGKTILCERK